MTLPTHSATTLPVQPSLSLAPRIRSALFEIAMNQPEQAPRWTMWTITVLFSLLVFWAIFAKLDIVAVAEGRLVPQTYVKIVQPSTAGIVREILVKEGDEVTQGQVLARLDPTENTADRTAVTRELDIQKLQVRRIDAELASQPLARQDSDDALLFAQAEAQRKSHRQAYLDSVDQHQAVKDRTIKELAAANEVLRKLERTMPSYQRSAEAYEKLAKQKMVGELQAEEMRRAAIENQQDLQAQHATVSSLEATVTESKKSLAQLKSAYESDLHTLRMQAISQISQLEQQQTKVQFQQSNLELKAPQAGIVKELATTTIGAVVQPGTVLVSLVPKNEPLLAEVMIDNQDIGFVKPGQEVRLKLAAYPFQRYGMVDGVVKTVIADSQLQNSKQIDSQKINKENPNTNTESGVASTMTFKATIELGRQSLMVNESSLPLAAGMQLSAEIIEGKRTVLQYLLSPVQRVASEAGMER
ncbi:MAG: HlyD family type I secretion periplasmic adaptor subunit [Steroidobacteraceae bacterium]